jgi:type I restriction enzyme, S subunit
LEVKEPSAKYLARPRYKQTEVGAVPEDWEVVNLGAVARDIYRGASPRPIDDPKWFDETSNIGWVRISDVTQSGRYLTETTQRLSQTGVRHSRYVPSGALIMSICATVGRPIETRIETCIHDGFVLFDRPTIEQGFLYHMLKDLEPRWSSKGQTGSQMNLNTALIKGARVPLPPTKAEQEAIAEALSDADALIESLEQLLAKKREIKQGAMQELLTSKKRLPGFRGKWEVKALGELFTFSGGLSASRDQLSAEGHCYLHYGDIHLSSKSFIDVRAEFRDIPKLKVPLTKVAVKSLLADGDVVFVDASEDDEGASKHVVVFNPDGTPFISGLHTIVAKSKTVELDHQFRRYCFQTRAVKAQFRFFAVGTKVSGISKTNIAKVSMPVPSVNEQIAIADILSDMDADIDAFEERLVKARQLKQGMMQELLTGKTRLVVPRAPKAPRAK